MDGSPSTPSVWTWEREQVLVTGICWCTLAAGLELVLFSFGMAPSEASRPIIAESTELLRWYGGVHFLLGLAAIVLATADGQSALIGRAVGRPPSGHTPKNSHSTPNLPQDQPPPSDGHSPKQQANDVVDAAIDDGRPHWLNRQTVLATAVLFGPVIAEYAALEAAVEFVGLRNLLFGYVIAPIAAFAFVWARRLIAIRDPNRKSGERVFACVLVIAGVLMIVPDPFFPPFYRGIAGWIVLKPQQNEGPDLTVNTVHLVDCNGVDHIYSGPIVNALSFFHRAIGRPRTDDERRDLLQFLFDEYRLQYPLASRGYGSYQWLLGDFSYPLHTPYGMREYSNLPPDDVCAIAVSTILADRDNLTNPTVQRRFVMTLRPE